MRPPFLLYQWKNFFEGPLSSKPGEIPMGGYNRGGGEKFKRLNVINVVHSESNVKFASMWMTLAGIFM